MESFCDFQISLGIEVLAPGEAASYFKYFFGVNNIMSLISPVSKNLGAIILL